jgi:acyl-CoA synthetase (AMP-forming)/AMP-acid ligase II
LPNYMAPRTIHCIDEFPLNANSKVDRKALREKS